MSRAGLLLVKAVPWCLGQADLCLAPLLAASGDHGLSAHSCSTLNNEAGTFFTPPLS